MDVTKSIANFTTLSAMLVQYCQFSVNDYSNSIVLILYLKSLPFSANSNFIPNLALPSTARLKNFVEPRQSSSDSQDSHHASQSDQPKDSYFDINKAIQWASPYFN